MSDTPVLEVRDLRKYYKTSSGFVARILGAYDEIKAVDDVSLQIQPGEVLGLVGESGSGKSTLGETTLRLEEPTAGSIRFHGDDITEYSDAELRRFRQNAQIIFQDPYESLNPKKTVFQIVSEPLRNYYDLEREEYEDRVSTMLEDLGLRPPENYLDAYPGQLSGGQRQRINVARALILEPDLLIADEPLSMLDVSIQAGILKILDDLREKLDFAMLYISHDLSVVNLVSDRVAVMYRGKIVEKGATRDVITDPKHPYTRALLSSLPDLRTERERVLIPDDPTDETELPPGCSFHPRCPDEMDVCPKKVPALAEAEGREVACFLHHDQSEAGVEAEADVDAQPAEESGTRPKP